MGVGERGVWEIISSLISSKKGRIYLRFIIALALIAAAVYAYSAIASVPSSVPAISNTNGTLLGSTQIANASIMRCERFLRVIK